MANVRITKPREKEPVKAAPAVKSSVTKEQLLKEIEAKAYELYLKRDGNHGNDLNDWLEAEKIVKAKYKI